MTTKNVGWRDAGIRAFLGCGLLLSAASLQNRPLLVVGIGFIALVFLGTALFRICPLYTVFGKSTSAPEVQSR